MHTCMTSTSFVLLGNGVLRRFFKASRGLRQGDPLSPLLFIVVMEALKRLLLRAREMELLRG